MDRLNRKCFAEWMVSRSPFLFLSLYIVTNIVTNTNSVVDPNRRAPMTISILLFFSSSSSLISVVSSSSSAERYGSDQVINTVLNINDSYTAGILNNFNVSKDEILRRISALQPAATQTNDNSRSSFFGRTKCGK